MGGVSVEIPEPSCSWEVYRSRKQWAGKEGSHGMSQLVKEGDMAAAAPMRSEVTCAPLSLMGTCSGLQTATPEPANKGGFRLTFHANKLMKLWNFRPVIYRYGAQLGKVNVAVVPPRNSRVRVPSSCSVKVQTNCHPRVAVAWTSRSAGKPTPVSRILRVT